MDIFVLCSYSECLPNALLEAMACGCSVVASSVGGIPEVIGRNERGLLFPAGDVDALAAQLTKLILDDRLRRDLGTRAAAYVREQFNVGRFSAAMVYLYERLLAQKLLAGVQSS